MHELSIAQALVEQVEAARQANGGGRVVSVDVRIGQWQHVVPEVLTSYFDYLTQGTPLEAARLHIGPVSPTAKCDECGHEFVVEDIYLICPSCASRTCGLVTGRELHLVGMELDD